MEYCAAHHSNAALHRSSALRLRLKVVRNPRIDSPRDARIVRGIKIRDARPADAAVIAGFNRRMAWETERRRLDPARVRRGVVALLRDKAKGAYFVAEKNGTVVGQLMITYEWSDWRNGNFWWIQSVYVRADSRGQGIFRALFEHVGKLARKRRDARGLRLYVDAHNGGARQTYTRLGMKKTDYELFETDFVL
jgi:GNAT superfamily N-acetyltransferase